MPLQPTKAKRVMLAVAGGLVGLVLIAAVISLMQGPSNSPMRFGTSSVGSAALGLQQAPRGMVAPGAPSYAADMAAAEESYAYGGKAMMPPISPEPPYGSGGQTAAEVDQKIIKNGSLRLTVGSVSSALSRTADIAKTRNGFVQNSSSSERGDGKHEGSITVRVPSSEFEAAVSDLKALALVVNYESTSGQDVTEQYTDLQAQLRNAKAQEEEYLRIMKKADTVEDILRVQERLGSVRGQIESLEGRIKYLENMTSFSTISVSLSEEAEITAPTKDFRPGTIVKQAVQALVEVGQSVVSALIWIAIVGGGMGVPVLVIVLVIRALIRRRKNQS